MNMTYAQFLVRLFEARRIGFLPAVYGLAELPLMRAIQDAGSIRVLRTHNESMALAIASAMAIRTGTPQVSIVTTAVGLTNLATGIYEAASRQAPVVAIACMTATSHWADDRPQRTACGSGVDPVKLAEGAGAKRVFVVPDAAGAGMRFAAQAFRLALAPRRGPVVLAVPENVFGECVAIGEDMGPCLHRGPSHSNGESA